MTENPVTNMNFARLCRCCALEHNLMYDIFCGTCSNSQTYYEIVMECARVQLFRDDGLPSLICHECVLILESFVTFRRKCIESESILKQTCIDISPDRRGIIDLNRDKQDDPMSRNIKEESNDPEYTTVFDDLEKGPSNRKCPELKLYDEIKVEETQVDRSNHIVYVKEEFIGTEETSNIYDGSLKRKTKLESKTKKPYSCVKCDKSFTLKTNLNRHEKVHVGEKLYPCDECRKSFASKSILDRHRKAHTGDKPYCCDRCDRSFKFISNLHAHQKVHARAKPYTCADCGKSFALKSILIVHRRTHTGDKPYACDDCGKSFTLKSILDQHRKKHADERPYACDRCDRSYDFVSNLRAHQRIHTGERRCKESRSAPESVPVVDRPKPYACDRCDKSFTLKSILDQHRKIHTGVKPYACDRCEKSFDFASNLRAHRIVHTRETPYACDTCSKSFTLKSILVQHLKTHTDEEPYS